MKKNSFKILIVLVLGIAIGFFFSQCSGRKPPPAPVPEPPEPPAATLFHTDTERETFLQYFSDDDRPNHGMRWLPGGETLSVTGTMYNLSSEYDIVSMDDAEMVLYDRNKNEVAREPIPAKAIGVIPHNGAFEYPFRTSNIPGGSSQYKASELIPRAHGSFSYVKCEGSDCPYCKGRVDPPVPPQEEKIECPACGGSGKVTCTDCGGSGKLSDAIPSISDALKALNGNRCALCDGEGEIFCRECHGTGYID